MNRIFKNTSGMEKWLTHQSHKLKIPDSNSGPATEIIYSLKEHKQKNAILQN